MSAQENSQERKEGKESFNTRLELIKEDLEGMKEKEIFHSDDIFPIVVKSLSEKGYELPNDMIYDFRKMNVGHNKNYIIVKFKGKKNNTLLYFSLFNHTVMAKVGKDDTYSLSHEDSDQYMEKYLYYAELFLKEKDFILGQKAKLGKFRLEKLGI